MQKRGTDMFYISNLRSWENLCNKDIVMPAHAYAWRTPYAILCCYEISQVSSYKNRHNVSLNLPTIYDVPPSPGLISAANIRISKIKNDKLTFFFWKKWFQNSRSKFCEVVSASSAPRQPRLSPVSYTTYSDMCKSTNTSRSLLPLWDSRVLTSNNQVKWVDKRTLPRANDALWGTETNWTDSEGTASTHKY